MLQQTQVATVLPYYERWMARFPTVSDLAAASEEEVLSIWQGLGYYRRCRMLLAGARLVAGHGFPRSALEWRGVPGIGRYTAGAIASIALGEAVAAVDGNVERVFARLAGCRESGTALNRAAWRWAPANISRDRPGDWNQALMELGATLCRPRDPLCGACPLSSGCGAFSSHCQSELPVPQKRIPTLALRREAWIHVCEERLGLERVPEGEWWEGMWRFPPRVADCQSATCLIGTIRHTVTRHRIAMAVYVVRCAKPVPGLSWFSVHELETLPLPSPYRRALKLYLETMPPPRCLPGVVRGHR